MKNIHIFTWSLLIAFSISQGCSGDPKKTTRPTTETTPAVPENGSADNAAMSKETPAQQRQEQVAVKQEEKPVAAPVKEEKTPGPPGYVTRENIFLLESPQANAIKICPLKRYEIISILETKMTDERGQYSDYPTWYRVELKNKKQGWVVGNSVSAGGGG